MTRGVDHVMRSPEGGGDDLPVTDLPLFPNARPAAPGKGWLPFCAGTMEREEVHPLPGVQLRSFPRSKLV